MIARVVSLLFLTYHSDDVRRLSKPGTLSDRFYWARWTMRRQALFGSRASATAPVSCSKSERAAEGVICTRTIWGVGRCQSSTTCSVISMFSLTASCGRHFRYAQVMRRGSSELGDHDAALPMSSSACAAGSGKDSSNRTPERWACRGSSRRRLESALPVRSVARLAQV